MKIAKVDAQAGAAAQGDASLEGAEFAIVNASGMNSFVNGHSYADGETVMTISTSWDGSAYTAQTASDALPCGTYRIVEANAPEGYLPWDGSSSSSRSKATARSSTFPATPCKTTRYAAACR